MPSNNKLLTHGMPLGVAMLLAGCAGTGGYDEAPRLAAPPPQAFDAPYNPEPQDYPPPERTDSPAQQSGYTLQGDYPPEPGGPNSFDQADTARPASRGAAGAGYDRPDGYAPPRYGNAPPSRKRLPDPLPADAPPAITAGTGPRATSGEAQRYDAVGYASWYGEEMGDGPTRSGQAFDASAITGAHRTLPIGSIVEVTALDTGRTILVLINDRGPAARDREIDLSRGAAQALGVNAVAPVRVRLVTASPPDVMALRSGRSAAPRIDAPPSLLAALRHKLPARPAPVRARRGSPAPTYTPPPAQHPAPGGAGIYVQVAALSNEGKAQALATSLGGRVQRAGSIYRIQIGPFANTASAQRARDDVARRGYGDARIVPTN